MYKSNIKFLNFGSLNQDMVYFVDHTVRPGETTASSKLDFFCGGKGLNQSIALARAGAKVYHAGCVGNDGALKYASAASAVAVFRSGASSSIPYLSEVEKFLTERNNI